ncbi:hypothetical protein B0H16DRAFT_1894677 [Mycena metata]|uniref:Uncharacterized protein n=1 Tax=Mycena metata TaxID=1033252 RepID=A0AAD7HRN8_9AGAR|nr:hypothetical protein B0H16DRAFT_1894677 [Mycena metata]
MLTWRRSEPLVMNTCLLLCLAAATPTTVPPVPPPTSPQSVVSPLQGILGLPLLGSAGAQSPS